MKTDEIKAKIRAEIDEHELIKAEAIVDFFIHPNVDQMEIWKAALTTVAKLKGRK